VLRAASMLGCMLSGSASPPASWRLLPWHRASCLLLTIIRGGSRDAPRLRAPSQKPLQPLSSQRISARLPPLIPHPRTRKHPRSPSRRSCVSCRRWAPGVLHTPLGPPVRIHTLNATRERVHTRMLLRRRQPGGDCHPHLPRGHGAGAEDGGWPHPLRVIHCGGRIVRREEDGVVVGAVCLLMRGVECQG